MFDNFGNFYCRKNIENKNKYVMPLCNSCDTCPDQTFFNTVADQSIRNSFCA